MRVFSVRVKFLEEHVKAGDRLMKLIRSQFQSLVAKGLIPRGKFGDPTGNHAPPPQVVPYVIPQRRPAVKLSVSDAAAKRINIARRLQNQDQRVLMTTFQFDAGTTYSRPVGGMNKADYHGPYHIPPPKDGRSWKKYWYFFRKRGSWRPSEHHPYGDEEPVITNWLDARDWAVND